ncbi:hypothetical protein KPH14_005544 [Odynerus spinipes]|uniref:Regulation of nuclear pre-mRNA domain-containing protein 2 n=1 Tax=Odynerus spinipes TaxID=1348599 RepID=A0AAD9RCJ3_9HYME|nr:hypothetical protein KPH14_005544 [Odynerus spinipes]
MATSDFDVELFERRLHTLKDSQESIQGLSAWCLERRQHHKKIVATWLQVLKKVKVEHRLTLFYLANDVIQYSKRKNFEFVESWGTTLQRATTMVRDEKVKHRILRIFKIWDQRQVYDEEFLADLSGLISAAPKKKVDTQPATAPEEFQAALLISTMRSCATLEQATDARLRDLRDSNIDIENAEELCASLKDRRRVEDAEKEVDLAVRNVENYVRALEAEIRERTQVLELLEQADQFYETQRGEVKIVTNAYRNFGSRVKNLKKKLDELLPTLVSPIPSPDVNAPSPSPDSDIELPGDENQTTNQSAIIEVAPPSIYGSYTHDYDPVPVPAPELSQGHESGDFTNNFSSFMGGNVDFGNMRNLFNERSTTPTMMVQQYNDSLEPKPIEVINMRPSKSENSEDFNISSFLKTVLPSSEGSQDPGGIPGLGLDVSDPQVGSPQRPNYRHSPALGQLPVTPVLSRMMISQGSSIGNLNNCPMNHSTPISVRNLPTESHTPSPYSSQNSQSNITVPFDGSSNANVVNPLPPPPLPPPIFLDDENCYNKLPPKFPTWTSSTEIKEPAKWEEKGKNSMNPSWPGENDEKNKTSWMDGANDRWESSNDSVWPNNVRGKSEILSETPESPPMYEKAGFTDPVEYNDSQPQEPLLSSAGDVDHRVIPIPLTSESQLPYSLIKAADVDHRNLISLTGSPANHNTINDTTLNVLPNNNSLWSTSDQDYRQHMQPGDIVESVDMEMSDDEADNKPKGRILVDVRSQDRDMRAMNPAQSGQTQHLDMDMRMIPLPSSQMSVSRGQMMQDVHVMHPGPPPPPPPPQFHQPQNNFHQAQSDFHHNAPVDFHPNQPNFHQNRPPPNFLQNQQEFLPGQQSFHEVHQQAQQEFEYHENQHNLRSNQDFHGESQLRNRYQPTDHQHRDAPPFHRNERSGRGGRGFPRNRRERYSDDHNHKQRPPTGIRKSRSQEQQQQHQRSPPEILPNSRPLLLQPPDTVVILDDEGMPIGMPDFEQGDVPPGLQVLQNSTQEETCPASIEDHRTQPDTSSSHNPEHDTTVYPAGSEHTNEESLKGDSDNNQEQSPQESAVSEETKNSRDEQYANVPEYTEHGNSESSLTEKRVGDNSNAENQTQEDFTETPQLSEQLEVLMGSNTTPSSSDLKRPSTNGDFDDQQEEANANKRILLSNGPPQTVAPDAGSSDPGACGTSTDVHPATGYEYDVHNSSPNFRPRVGGPAIFSPWRNGPPRGRSGFRGGPRAPWMDRGPRGPSTGNFVPRGPKRGGQFRGGGFRGRGRSGNW